MLEFQLGWLFWAWPLPFAARFLLSGNLSHARQLRIPSTEYLPAIVNDSSTNSFIKALVLWSVWSLLICAAARPVWLGTPVEIGNKYREIMVAVDLSASMSTRDMQLDGAETDRLTVLKRMLGQFVEQRAGDKLGLILFGDTAYVQTPLTFDLATVDKMLQESEIGLVGQRTAIGDAIGLSAKRFDSENDQTKLMLLITDGKHTSGNITPEEGLQLARKKQMTLYTIGMGAEGADELDEALLIKLAEQTGGQYFRARDSESLAAIYSHLNSMEKFKADPILIRPVRGLFFWPLGLALCLTCLAMLVEIRKNHSTRSMEPESHE